MARILLVLALMGSCLSFASTINTSTVGTDNPYTGTYGAGVVKFSNLVGTTISVTFGDGTTDSCVFGTFGAGIGCTGTSGNFNFLGTPPSSNIASAGWLVTSSNAASYISTITINTLPSGVGFDATISPTLGPVPNITSDSSNGSKPFLVGNDMLDDPIHLSGQAVSSATEYALLVLSGFGTTFTNGLSFGFKTGNTFLTSATADTPEPTTLSLIGLGLAGFGAMRFRRRSRS